MKNTTFIFKSIFLIIVHVQFSALHAATFSVINTNDSGAGSLRQAIIDANSAAGADIIDVTISGTVTLASDLPNITESVTINGNDLIIDGNNAHDYGEVASSQTVTINNLTFQNGQSTDEIFENNGILTLTKVSFLNNLTTTSSDEVFHNRSIVTMTDCTFSGNMTGNMTGDNPSSDIFENDGTATLTNCTFSGNSTAGASGDVFENDGTATLTNCTFSGNSTAEASGDVFENQGTATLTNCTFSGNSAAGSSGDVFDQNGTLNLRNTIIANTTSGDNFQGSAALSTNVNNIVEGCNGICPTFFSTADPNLGALADNGGTTQTMALLMGSPAIDAGNAASCETTDQRGYGRSGTCDIGAFEYNGVAPPEVTLSVSANSGTEAGTTVITVTATGSASSVSVQTVDLAVTGTGITTGDYTLSSTTITILAGATTGTVTFTIQNDDVVEANTETATLTISNPSSGIVLGSTTSQNVTITDNDQATVTIADVAVNENSGTATITLSVDKAVDGGFSVDVSTADGTATVGDSDYSAVSSATETFAGTASETETFTITLGGDTKVEADETLTISMGNKMASTVDAADIDITDGATLTINNDDQATVTIADVMVNENSGTATITLTLDNEVDGGFSVDVSTMNGSAMVADGDYTALTGQTKTFSGNAGETQTVMVTLGGDTKVEGDETVAISMSNKMASTVGAGDIDITDGATLTILNDDVMYTFDSQNDLMFMDPCSCTDPLNCSINGVTYFHDTLTITTGGMTGLSITVDGSSPIMDFYTAMPGDCPSSTGMATLVTGGTAIPETPTGSGVYKLEFWRPSGATPVLSVTQSGMTTAVPASTFQPICTNTQCEAEPIPTVSEWGMIILGLLFLIIGLLAVSKQKVLEV